MDENKSKVDWERVEIDYRAGIMSLREIADKAGITEGAIRKRAKRDDWVRDLTARVHAKADELVRMAEVREKVRNDPKTVREIVDIAANQVATVHLTHRKDIRRARDMTMHLLTQLEGIGVADELRVQIDNNKKLADTLKVLVAMERESYGMDKIAEEDKKQAAPLLDVSKLSTSALKEIVQASKDANSSQG